VILWVLIDRKLLFAPAMSSFLAKISLYSDPVWEPKSHTAVGGCLTVLVIPVICGYVLWQVLTGLNAPTFVSFLGMGQVGRLESGLKINFECTSSNGCIVCPLPCKNGLGKIVVAQGEKQQVAVPFFAFQNTHSRKGSSALVANSTSGYNIGLERPMEKDAGPLKIGQLSGKIDVALSPDSATPSIKILPTKKHKLDGSTLWEYDSDISDECTEKQRGTGKAVADLDKLGPTSVLYPFTDVLTMMDPSSSEIYYSTVCSTSTYFELEENQQQLSIGGLLGQAGGFYASVGGLFSMINSKTWRRFNQDTAVIEIKSGDTYALDA